MSDKSFTTKLGTTRAGERSRIWLEGKRLVAHGFEPGTRILKTWFPDKLVISVALDLTRQSSDYATVSGKGDKPIIDITGQRVRETFGTSTHVDVTYRADRITIKRQEA